MITAKDAANRLKCMNLIPEEELDNWIETQLYPKMKGNTTLISFTPYPKENFIAAMNVRGFCVEYVCEDHPCGSCYYKITIPPQGE